MSRVTTELSNPLMRGLACAALHSKLRSILVFDATIATLNTAAQNLAAMLKQTTTCNVTQVQLGVVETEEDLWGSLALQREDEQRVFGWEHGILAEGRDTELRLVVIPDLTRLSLAAARACVALMGSEVAYVERHGHGEHWRPNLCWVAGCRRQDVGLVSPHLLDRFALRLGGQDWEQGDRATAIRAWLQQGKAFSPEQEVVLPSSELLETLRQAQLKCPEITPSAQKRALDYVVVNEGYSVRRELALLRLAQANAQLEGAERVEADQVDLAAKMVGLEPLKPSREQEIPQSLPEIPAEKKTERKPLTRPIREEGASNKEQQDAQPVREPVYAPDTTEELPAQPLVMEGEVENPYPEDTTPIEREAASLRLPMRRFRTGAVGRGAIVGVEPATVPQDLAIVSTLMEAAKYQSMRRAASGTVSDRLILRPTDLRRYRRAVVPEQMLAVVLDYTCLKECQWQAALLPYLQWAYVERANLCLIQVGAANASKELQAEKIVAQNVLVPRISHGLEASGGRATPLAHGLDLALQTLRHALQHGRSVVRQVVLVVLSDGRGNVPLEASRTNQIPVKPVNRLGIEDAMQVAMQIADLKQVDAVVLNPQPKFYADLPVQLAQALGAKIAAIPSLNAWEVDS